MYGSQDQSFLAVVFILPLFQGSKTLREARPVFRFAADGKPPLAKLGCLLGWYHIET